MHVVLIRPPACTSVYSGGMDACAPIGLAYIAASLKEAGHAVSAVDAVGEALDQWSTLADWPGCLAHGLSVDKIVERIPKDADAVGISSMFSREWPLTRFLLIEIRNRFPNTPIIAGGEHITACPQYVLDNSPVDYCVMGEGEEVIADLATLLETERNPKKVSEKVCGICTKSNGEIIATKRRPRIREIDQIAQPYWDIFPVQTYIDGKYSTGEDLGKSIPILASRGCPYQCTFCSSPVMWTQYWNIRNPEHVVAEMKKYISSYGVTNFDLLDLTAIIRKSWIVDFAKLLIHEKLNTTWQLPTGSRSEAIDEEVAGLLYKSGCRNMTYAPESGSIATLKKIKKKIKPDRMLKSMEEVNSCGLHIRANIIIGFPHEGIRNVLETYSFLIKMAIRGVNDIGIYPFSPYPGSEIFNEMLAKGDVSLNEDYFKNLGDFTTPTHAKSHCPRISDFEIRFLICFGVFIFYIASFTAHPWKLGKFLINLMTNRADTKLSRVLKTIFMKLKVRKNQRRTIQRNIGLILP